MSGQPSQTDALPRDATYQPGVGRILTVGQSIPGIRTFVYDSAGNEAFSYLVGDAGGNHPSEDRRSYYDASGRLVAAEWRYLPSQGNPGTYGYKKAFEEYRLDPLGRRIWVRAQRDCYLIPSTMPDLVGLSIECSRSFVRRTIWDGQQEVAEIQAPDNATDREVDGSYFSAQALINGKDPNPYYGRAIYTYGHTIDQPLSIFRLGYSDWPQGGSYTTSAWGTFAVMPFWDATGNAKIGAFGSGAAVRQLSGPPPAACQTGNSPQRCVKLYWPETFTALDRLKGFTPQMYVGSLFDRKRDATGTEYKRNRTYDPKTGRFTQEDPVGVAGGLNLYGFANGDPVNLSDPFGLCPYGVTLCTIWQRFLDWRDANARAFEASCERNAQGACKPVEIGVPGWIGGRAAVQGAELGALESQFQNITKELKRFNHFQAARMERAGRLNTGADHGRELEDFANGLRNSVVRLKRMLSDQSSDMVARQRVQQLLSNASSLRDRIMETLRR